MKMIIPAVVLTVICAVAALALAGVQRLTAPRIEDQERDFRLRSIKQAIPTEEASQPDHDVVTIEHEGEPICVFRGRHGGEVRGVAFPWTAKGGYSGDFRVLVGITPDGRVACDDDNGEWLGLQILQHAETPGLGALMEDSRWRVQFCGHSLQDDLETYWQVRKDGGRVDQLTGATITSRAVAEAIVNALSFFEAHRDDILDAPAGGTCEE